MHLMFEIPHCFYPEASGCCRGSCVSFCLAQKSLSSNAGTSSTNFSINSVNEILLGETKSVFVCSGLVVFFCLFFFVIVKTFHYFLTQNTHFFFYSSSCSVFAFSYEAEGTLSRHLSCAFLVKGIKRKH